MHSRIIIVEPDFSLQDVNQEHALSTERANSLTATPTQRKRKVSLRYCDSLFIRLLIRYRTRIKETGPQENVTQINLNSGPVVTARMTQVLEMGVCIVSLSYVRVTPFPRLWLRNLLTLSYGPY